MEDCLFCKIAAGEIPSKKLYEDETVLAFYDIDPQAPFHALVIPKKHITNLMELEPGDAELVSHMLETVTRIARENGIDKTGFRTVMNTGRDGQQSVEHLHMHVLGKRMMSWPPG